MQRGAQGDGTRRVIVPKVGGAGCCLITPTRAADRLSSAVDELPSPRSVHQTFGVGEQPKCDQRR